MNFRIYLVAILFAMNLSGCSTSAVVNSKMTTEPLALNTALFKPSTPITTEQELFALTPEQEQHFLAYVAEKEQAGGLSHEIVSNYILNQISKFTYYGKNYKASEALRLNKGNCMSLAILTVSLSRLVGIDYDFREVVTIPIFEKHGNLLLSSRHVQTRLYDPTFIPKENTYIVGRPGIVIDYFPDQNNIKSRYLTKAQFLSMYYQNISADALLVDDLDFAFANAKRAYDYDPSSVKVFNLLGVLHRRKGDMATAEQIYQSALALETDNLSLMNNYIILLEGDNRAKEALQLKVQMEQLDDPNPYTWLEQAYLEVTKQNFHEAIKYYKKVLTLAPYISEAYLGLYQSYKALGKTESAEKALITGLDWAHSQEQKQRFKYKLYGSNLPET